MAEETVVTEVSTEETTKETTVTTESTTNETTEETITTVIPTADELLALSEKEWEEFKTAFEAALKAKAAEEKAILKAKIATITTNFKTYALPVIKYGAGAALLLKVFNII
ncbi:hypothetical protein [Pelosinus propionicus]|uniref:Uncharacterized protein n=1 Tax=Pelosinus propionicus DSM 13327 TaxID=1123291 RepID=A0A1I4QP47_9FIRM|nr:hypothetical protein [Pelosinus propionicus]SFM41789.1 hypothetical protein SAMN04490355_11163 [Pelosinus propionicus DSM 13327]